MADLHYTLLDDLAVLDVRGAHAVSFLQGQLTQDVSLLCERGSLLAALANAEGRVMAVLRLLQVSEQHVLLILPAELAESTRQLLARYVLRAKVTITDASASWRVYGIAGPDADAAASTRICAPLDDSGWRQLIVAPRVEALPEVEPATPGSWQLADIEAGIPQVLGATSGSFVAQMLNLDLLQAVSFDKGCYTGQEVIARAHYRGQVKRRMQRFFTESLQPLHPGQRIQLGDGRAAQIVICTPGETGGQHFLAVARLPQLPAEPEPAAAESHPRVDCVTLPLPYQWPNLT